MQHYHSAEWHFRYGALALFKNWLYLFED